MTMNNNNSSNVPSSTQGIMVPAHMQQPFMRKGLPLLSHNINRKPVRRALVELGRNDRKHNSKLANRLLTISTEEFKQKWNFDPIKMKPITEGSNGATTAAPISGDGLGHKKYQWELVKQTKAQVEEYEDKKELERTVFSLVAAHTDRKQMRLSTVAVQVSQSDDTSQGKASSSELEAQPSRIPQLKEEESIVSSTTEEEPNTVSAATQSITDNGSNSQQQEQQPQSITDNGSNSQQQEQQPQSITVASNEQRTKEEELRRRLTAAANAVPTITSATITNNTTLASRQSKITDFASHRKIVHGPTLKEESDLQPPSKRPRLTC